MARRTKEVTITKAGRDCGKVFHLTEMPADQGERWANRAIIAIANAGGRLPEGVLENGMAGLEVSFSSVVLVGMQALAGLKFTEIEPLLDEMMPFIKYCPPIVGQSPMQPIFPGDNSQIEEVATRYMLRYELLQLHLDFSLAAKVSTTGTGPEAPTAS